MSVRLMAMVFDAKGFTSTQKLVLLALADHANEDGHSIYPSVRRLCDKTALKERVVRRTLDELRRNAGEQSPTDTNPGLGVLRITAYSTERFPTQYAINVKALAAMVPPALDAGVHKMQARGAFSAPPGMHHMQARGAPGAPKPPEEPALKPPEEPAAAGPAIQPAALQSAAAAVELPDSSVEALKALDEAGIGEPKKSQLARLPHTTPDFVNAHFEAWKLEREAAVAAGRDVPGTGLLVKRLESGEKPAPAARRRSARSAGGREIGRLGPATFEIPKDWRPDASRPSAGSASGVEIGRKPATFTIPDQWPPEPAPEATAA